MAGGAGKRVGCPTHSRSLRNEWVLAPLGGRAVEINLTLFDTLATGRKEVSYPRMELTLATPTHRKVRDVWGTRQRSTQSYG